MGKKTVRERMMEFKDLSEDDKMKKCIQWMIDIIDLQISFLGKDSNLFRTFTRERRQMKDFLLQKLNSIT